ncbi:MAG: hypothetical protein WDA22_16765 [Bacteroidota bacterium]
MKRIFIPIVFTGLLAGTLDISAAMLRYYFTTGKDPMNVLRFIASGVFGNSAFSGGIVMASYGLLFHFVIAFSWTTLFFVIYPKLMRLSKNKYLLGIVYSVVIWSGMNLVVLPLSNVPQLPFTVAKGAEAIGILIVCVGLPISILAHRYYTKLNTP